MMSVQLKKLGLEIFRISGGKTTIGIFSFSFNFLFFRAMCAKGVK